jgi:hypothetical protein
MSMGTTCRFYTALNILNQFLTRRAIKFAITHCGSQSHINANSKNEFQIFVYSVIRKTILNRVQTLSLLILVLIKSRFVFDVPRTSFSLLIFISHNLLVNKSKSKLKSTLDYQLIKYYLTFIFQNKICSVALIGKGGVTHWACAKCG